MATDFCAYDDRLFEFLFIHSAFPHVVFAAISTAPADEEAAEDEIEKVEEVKADADDEGASPEPKAGGTKKLTNQFNYSERASQTYNNPYRV